MMIFDKEFTEMYPEIIEHLRIESERDGSGKFTVFSVPTQHFTIESLSELTEENILNHINVDSWTGSNKKYGEKKQNSLRRIKLEKILQ